MATDIQVAAHGEQLPTIPVVKEWTEVELLSFILKWNRLKNDKNCETFKNAEIKGSNFLAGGDDISFWHDGCGLPFGPSYGLAQLVKEIKGIKPQGNVDAHPSRPPSNQLTR